MKKRLGPRPYLNPMPVMMIGTYNEDGTPNLMNAAWGGQMTATLVMLSLSPNHKTVENIRRTQAFTIGVPSIDQIEDCDYVGMVSGNDVPDKVAHTNLRPMASKLVEAPIYEEFPYTMECVVERFMEDPVLGFYVIGKVKAIQIEEKYLLDSSQRNIDVDAMNLCYFSPIDSTYRHYGEVVAKAFTAKKGN